jgi:hypothetical protein
LGTGGDVFGGIAGVGAVMGLMRFLKAGLISLTGVVAELWGKL